MSVTAGKSSDKKTEPSCSAPQGAALRHAGVVFMADGPAAN